MTRLSTEDAKALPIFKVWADGGSHPPVALDRPVCVIGRREVGVNLPLHAPQVSKLHALVVRTQRRVYVRDLASRNGVQRNGEPVQEVGLSDEDVLRIGSYTLRCASGFGHAAEPTADESGMGTGPADVPPLPSAPAAELVATNGLTYPFPGTHQTLLIGHREGCEVRLDDERVAPVHAILFEMDGKRHVRDLGAPGGTYLNDVLIHQSELKAGDALRVGNVTLIYAQVDPTRDEVVALDPIGISDSLVAPSVDLGDSVTDPNVVTADSMILPEITMEDSTTPAPAAPPVRAARPISEYDFDVVEPDPRRESTFHGEVIADRPARPELPPDAADAEAPSVGADAAVSTESAPPQRLDDSSIGLAGSFHDSVLEDHLLQDVEDPHALSRDPLSMADDERLESPPGVKSADTSEPVDAGEAAASAPAPPTTEVPTTDASTEASTEEPTRAAPAIASPAPPALESAPPAAPSVAAEVAAAETTAADTSPRENDPEAEAAITHLVDDVTEQVTQVSKKVEVVAAKVERVAAKMSEVTKDVGEVAETAGALKEAWTDFRGGTESENHLGASDKSSKTARGAAEKTNPRRVPPVKPRQSAPQEEPDS